MEADGREHRGRRRGATALAVFVTLTLSIGITAAWGDYAFADSDEFARRAVSILDSATVRQSIAEEIADHLVQTTPQLNSFRFVLTGVIEDIVQTDAFHRIFQAGIREAHRAVFTRSGQEIFVNLTQAVAVITTTLQIINPEAASKLPPDTSQVILEVSDKIQSAHLWEIGDDLRELAATMLVLTVLGLVAMVAVEPRKQRAVLKAGFAVVCAALIVLGATFLAPSLATRPFTDPLLAHAIDAAVFRFLGDLRSIGFWMLAYGVILVTLGSAVAPRGEPVRLSTMFEWLRRRGAAWEAGSPARRLALGIGLVAASLVLILGRHAVVPLAIAAFGAYVGYLGLFHVLKVVAPTERPVSAHRGKGVLERITPRTVMGRSIAVAGVTVVIVLFVTVGFAFVTRSARDTAVASAELECNGAAELCDRRLDEVAFAAAHNAMSAADTPGWLFAENNTGIADQLEYGIRAFLVKSHYGRPSGISIAGAELVVTDKQAEVAAQPTASEGEIGADAAARARELSEQIGLPNVAREVYLCHVYCELGATKFSDALDDVKTFLDRNPNEVLIFVIGNFVSDEDTDAVFEEAGLADRRWEYDPSQPLPTLRELIENGTNLVVMSENSGQPPAWNIHAYEQLLQDTPFTFTNPDEFSCAPNRGPADAPMFQINHWITPKNEPPNPSVGAQVNAYDVLMPRVRQCQQERGKLPNIVGVNFYSSGDLLRVVDELNEVDVDRT